MTKLILLFTLLSISMSVISQTIETNYSKGTKSSSCGEEKFRFVLEEESITRIDKFDGSKITIFSKKQSGNFDNNGQYSESWGSKFYLDKYGINAFDKIKQYTYRIVYDKRGGNLLYILEIDNKKGLDEGKVYMSEIGYGIICK